MDLKDLVIVLPLLSTIVQFLAVAALGAWVNRRLTRATAHKGEAEASQAVSEAFIKLSAETQRLQERNAALIELAEKLQQRNLELRNTTDQLKQQRKRWVIQQRRQVRGIQLLVSQLKLIAPPSLQSETRVQIEAILHGDDDNMDADDAAPKKDSAPP